MDNWLKATYQKLKEFAGDEPGINQGKDSPKITLNEAECYCLIKALDAFAKYENGELIDDS